MLIGYDPVKFHFEVSLFSPDDLKLHTKFRETSLFETSLYETSRHYFGSAGRRESVVRKVLSWMFRLLGN